MTIEQTINLLIKSSTDNPYKGKLAKEDKILGAIVLAKLCKRFAVSGQSDNAMNLDAGHWEKVIKRLKEKSKEFKKD